MRLFVRILVCAAAITAAGCSTNPVTGDRELSLMSQSQEIALGEQNYEPYQQQQGGEYEVDPELTEYVSRVGQRLAAVSDRDLPYEFVVINNSVPNAWALPGGKIAINRGLLNVLENEAQLAAVLGHEIVHAAAGHSAQQMSQSTLLGLGVQIAGIAAQDSDYGQLIGLGAQLGAGAWQAHHSRDAELEADRYGIQYMVEAGYNPQGAVELQEKFVEMSEGQGSGFMQTLFASHPPSEQRLETNRKLAEQYGRTGEVNREAYAQATEQIREDADAYEAHVKAQVALQEGDPDRAEQLTEQAISMQPAEALFYTTKGQALIAQEEYQEALQAFEEGARNNPDYFMGYLGQGLMHKALGQQSEARQSLQKSVDILPTQVGMFHLGELAHQAGDVQQAAHYYRTVAQSGGELGQAAQQRLAQLQQQVQGLR